MKTSSRREGEQGSYRQRKRVGYCKVTVLQGVAWAYQAVDLTSADQSGDSRLTGLRFHF